jgi:hypothetical protein
VDLYVHSPIRLHSIVLNCSKPTLIRSNWGEVIRIIVAKGSPKELRTQINVKFNDISSGDEIK